MVLNNLISILSIGAVLSTIWAFKGVLDKEQSLSKNPWIANKLFRVLSGLALCSLVFIAFTPKYSNISFVVFLILAFSILFFVTDKLKKQSYIGLKFEQVSIDTFLSIPSSHYVQVQPGFFDRTVLHPDDMNSGREYEFKEILKTLDFDNNIVLFVEYTSNGFFEKHATQTTCTIWNLKGKIAINGDIYLEGDFVELKPGQVRDLKGIENGLLLATIAKQ